MIVSKREKGFTLVELLIVIVVIGVLSTMMMLSSTEAVTSAKASNIVSNLRNWKTATLAYYTDHIDEVEGFGDGGKTAFTNFADYVHAVDIIPYLNGEFKTSGFTVNSYAGTGTVQDGSGNIYFTKHHTSVPKVWMIGCEFPDDSRVKAKLEGRAKSIGLVTAEGKDYTASTGNCVYVKVADFNN